MPRKIKQKQRQAQKQTVIVNVGSSKSKTRTNRKKTTGKRGKSNVSILPPPIHQVYTSPIHNLTPQYFSQGQQLSIPSLAEQQIGSQIKNNNIRNEMDMSLIERMQKQINENKNAVDEMNSYMNQSQPSGYSLDDRSEISSIYSNPDSDWNSRNSMSNEPYYSLSKEMSDNSSRQSNSEFLQQYYGNKINNSSNNSLDNDLLQRMEQQMKIDTPVSNVNVIPYDESSGSGTYDLSSMYSDNSALNRSLEPLRNPTKKYSEMMNYLNREFEK